MGDHQESAIIDPLFFPPVRRVAEDSRSTKTGVFAMIQAAVMAGHVLVSQTGSVTFPVEKGFASGIILCTDISTGEKSAHHDNRDDCKKNISRQHRIA